MPAQTVLVTGASSGIGKALCEEFARDGYDLILTARSVETMQHQRTALEQRYGIRVTVIGADLETSAGAEKLHSDIKASGVVLNVLVNNAGYGTFGEFKDTPLSATLGMMQLNMNSVIILSKLFCLLLLNICFSTDDNKFNIVNVNNKILYQSVCCSV